MKEGMKGLEMGGVGNRGDKGKAKTTGGGKFSGMTYGDATAQDRIKPKVNINLGKK